MSAHQWEFDAVFGAIVRRTWSPGEAEALVASELSWMESIEDEIMMEESDGPEQSS